MTWSYTPDFTTQKDRVRREIGDVVSTDQLLSDEEIAYAETIEGSDLNVAARCCQWISLAFGRKADMTEGKLSIKLHQRAEFFAAQALLLRSRAAVEGALLYVGGESVSDKEANDDDTDRVPPAFWRGMSDNPSAVLPTPESTNTGQDPSTE